MRILHEMKKKFSENMSELRFRYSQLLELKKACRNNKK